ncbi:uncharacterized protein METZ01_LOCUS209623, partial [marine metagenome]
SNTASPTQVRTTWPTLRSPSTPAPAGNLPSARPSPANRSRAEGSSIPSATVLGSRGTPSTLGEGNGRRAPSSHTEAVRVRGATNSPSSPASVNRSVAHGTLTRKESAPSSTGRPTTGLVTSRPPALVAAS